MPTRSIDPRQAGRLRYAQMLMEQGASTAPVQSPFEGVARALQGGVGGYFAGEAEREVKDREKASTETLVRALEAGKGSPAGLDAKTGITWDTARPGSQDMMLSILAGNQDTAPAALQMRMSEIQNQAALDKALKLEKIKTENDAPKTRTIKRDGAEVTEQWNPSTRTFEQIATSPQGTPRRVGDTRDFLQGGNKVTQEWDGKQWVALGSGPAHKPEKEPGGPFGGTGMDPQALNIVAAYQQKKAQGQPTTQQEDFVYSLATRHLTEPKVVGTPETGFNQITPPPLPAYPGAQPPAQAAPPVQPAPPAQQPAPVAPVAAGEALPPTAGTAGITPLTTPRKPETFNEGQGKAAGFSDRMTISNSILDEVGNQGANFWGRLKEKAPGGNYLQSDEYQKFEQARRDFINAQLRRESGAVISPEEFANADRQYFPVPGDSDAVIKQKAQNRATALDAMKRDAGPAYKPKQKEPPAIKKWVVQDGQLVPES